MDLRADRATLNKLFGTIGEQFQVPPFQRPYAWEAEQIDDLWDDLVSTLEDGHFLGTIVLSETRQGRPQIIDGQQRLTTLLVLLGLVRDEYHRLGSPYWGRVQQLMMADQYASGDASFRLRIGAANWRPFRDLVLRSTEDPDRLSDSGFRALPKDVKARNAQLFSNRERLSSRLSAWLDGIDGAERIARLERLEKSIAGKLQLVAIRVGSVADAFLLFETLNDRGLQLSAADLLKNHLLARIAHTTRDEEAVNLAAAEWDLLLDDLGPQVDVTRFLRHYLLIQRPKVRKDDVYDRFKDEVERIGPYRLLAQLRVFAKFYGDFENPARVEEPDVAAVLEDLKTLRATSCYSALMPARRFLSSEAFIGFARLAEVLTYRYSTIASMDSKELERVYHRAAKQLADSEGKNLREARSELTRVMPDSQVFRAAFMQQRMGRHYLVRYTLGRIEEAVSREREKQLRSNTKVHIEHVMPQTLNTHWREQLGDWEEEHPEFVNRWGNLTLLYYRSNSSISNAPFARKKQEYEKSEVELTRRLCDFDGWEFEEILRRQEWLAEQADQLWSVEALEQAEGFTDVTQPELSPVRFLAKAEARAFEELVVETSAEEALGLVGRIDAYERMIEDDARAGGMADSTLGSQIAANLRSLARQAGSLDARGRSWLRAAVEYFVLSEDQDSDLASPSGLLDDARVANAVSRALGREELMIPLPE